MLQSQWGTDVIFEVCICSPPQFLLVASGGLMCDLILECLVQSFSSLHLKVMIVYPTGCYGWG